MYGRRLIPYLGVLIRGTPPSLKGGGFLSVGGAGSEILLLLSLSSLVECESNLSALEGDDDVVGRDNDVDGGGDGNDEGDDRIKYICEDDDPAVDASKPGEGGDGEDKGNGDGDAAGECDVLEADECDDDCDSEDVGEDESDGSGFSPLKICFPIMSALTERFDGFDR